MWWLFKSVYPYFFHVSVFYFNVIKLHISVWWLFYSVFLYFSPCFCILFQCYKTPHFHVVVILICISVCFSMFQYFILQTLNNPFSVFRITEMRIFKTLAPESENPKIPRIRESQNPRIRESGLATNSDTCAQATNHQLIWIAFYVRLSDFLKSI